MFTDESLLMSLFPSFFLPCVTLWESRHLCEKRLFLSRARLKPAEFSVLSLNFSELLLHGINPLMTNLARGQVKN